MSDKQEEINDKTKVEGGFSVEELENLIAQEDPEFSAAIKEIQSENAKSELNIELINLDEVMRVEKEKSLKARLHRLKVFIRLKLSILWIHTKNITILSGQKTIEGLKFTQKKIGDGLYYLKYLELKLKLLFVLVIFLVAGTSFYIYRAVTYGWLGHAPPLFVRSLDEWAQAKYTYNPKEDMESFYDSSRLSQNLFSLKKIVVNIRRSENSGSNPMAAFEFYLEGSAAEVIVEVKDRESEMRDHFQRVIEEMTYDQLSSKDGKQLLLEKLRRETNKLVTSGQIKKIYIKTVVIKP